MVSKGKPSPRSAVEPLLCEQVAKLGELHHLVDPTRYYPAGPRTPNQAEIDEQNPKATSRLLEGASRVIRASCKTYAWGLEQVPETGTFITAATHVTQFDVFVPMMALFHQGRRPRYMAKAEMARWPLIGRWFRWVGMQPVPRRSGQAQQIEQESIKIITSGRPLTIWPEGTVTRDPLKWPMSLKPGVGIIALKASRQLGYMVPLYPCVTWGAASINHWWPWPRKNVVMCYDHAMDYSDLLADVDTWGEEPPQEAVNELCRRLRERMEVIMTEIRGIDPPAEGYFDFRTMTRKPRPAQTYPAPALGADRPDYTAQTLTRESAHDAAALEG
ncbi:1-acyl-sn-glycerol-3-phosphate acyltransferase [Bombiscardovia apis]|uniref:1-acyl-sn-glycerol-3-phosphate acyltransferase n=1 Tax=Bombiscardovia apis TaxID=2932182 RepID=A0ABM8BBC0_9BIFI|nr:lysophospholipid acyltransferase family protein [Bombiscardovia apis]BDR54149.1 1-acyl-sn-glycerol-3-phosphate acyltransferase [Bombiscardovia apis]